MGDQGRQGVAPARIIREQQCITEDHTRLDRWRYAAYQHGMPGVDKTMRKFGHSAEKGRRLVGKEDIR